MESLESLEGELVQTVRRLERQVAFVEVLAGRSTGEAVRMNRQTTTVTAEATVQGAIVRAWSGTRWVEAGTSELTGPGLGATSEAILRAVRLAPGTTPPPGPSASTVGRFATRSARPMSSVGTEDLLALGKDVLTWAQEVPDIRDAQFLTQWQDDERLYLNSAGANAYQRISRVLAGTVPIAISEGKAESSMFVRGGQGGQEIVQLLTQEEVREAAEEARALLGARKPPSGDLTVLLDPGATGIFAHESFGHGTEADQFVRDRSYLKPILGSMVGPEALTIVDDGGLPGVWGSLYFDDEGHPAHHTPLVEHGRFVGALHDRETAAVLGAEPTANTRRADFLSRAYVRMTNTFVEPGGWTKEELLQEAKDGVVLEGARSGVEDPLGGQMQVKVHHGHLIEHGEETALVSSMALSGRVLDFLRSIRGIGRASDEPMMPGFCGKGHTDLLPVSDGGPYLLSRAVVGPA